MTAKIVLFPGLSRAIYAVYCVRFGYLHNLHRWLRSLDLQPFEGEPCLNQGSAATRLGPQFVTKLELIRTFFKECHRSISAVLFEFPQAKYTCREGQYLGSINLLRQEHLLQNSPTIPVRTLHATDQVFI